MSQLRVVATIPIKPEGVAAAGPALAELAAASQAEEGCLGYEVFASTSVAGTFVTIESWRSADDMTAHMSTPHVAKAFEVLGPVLDGDLAIHQLDEL
ncbi:putative quinol monooxygenase [Nocardioides psychrotolerans]|uniref:putative quinol monooxygenase n=1 Tax=Nocardioides psychrotolerans TaxID=1005945 RepID=UPI003137BF4D